MSGKTYLITGAGRGIGRCLFEHYAAQSNNILIGAVRDVTSPTAKSLHAVVKGQNTKILVTKIDSASKTDPYDAVKDIIAQGVDHIDVILSCAGIAKMNTIEDVPLEEFEESLSINAISVLLLAKATLPLLRKAAAPSRFAFISAAGGSLAEMQKYPYPNISYAGSKALANAILIKLGMENDFLITLAIHPGLVQTDLGNMGAKSFGLAEAPVTLKACAKNVSTIIDSSTKEQHSEKFYDETIDKFLSW